MITKQLIESIIKKEVKKQINENSLKDEQEIKLKYDLYWNETDGLTLDKFDDDNKKNKLYLKKGIILKYNKENDNF